MTLPPKSDSWSCTLACDPDEVDVASARLWAAGSTGVWVRATDVVGYFDERVETLDDGDWELVADTDWLSRWRDGIGPITAGAFEIVPTWLAAEHASTEGLTRIVMDPGQAFGSGHHETTAGCLEALSGLPLDGRKVLDVGTGTGILAIAAALKGATVTAVDIDPAAVEVARANAADVGVAIDLGVGSIGSVPGPFDVVLANLLTHTIVELSHDLVAALVPGGRLIASGIGVARAQEARTALVTAGLVDPTVISYNEWVVIMGTAAAGTLPGVIATVDGFTHGGEGVVRLDGKATFVPGALPGERVRIEVIEDHKKWARARLLDVIEPAPGRAEPPCTYATECGGCDLQHVDPEAALVLKTRVVTEQLQRLGGLVAPNVATCRSVGPALGYRNNAQLHAREDGALGFHRAQSHDVVAIDRCIVLSDDVQRVVDQTGGSTGAIEVQARAHPVSGTAAVVLTPGPGPLTPPPGEFDVTLAQPDASTIAIRGDGVLTEQVAGLTYQFDPSSFFQVNIGGAQAIIEEVRKALDPVSGLLVWDLYAGVGLISLALAADGADVVAVEGHKPAAEWARSNADANSLSVDVVTDDVHRHVAKPSTDPPDAIVLDPPRTGVGAKTAAAIAGHRPGRIVYVACDPASLARDAKALGVAGYRLEKAVPLDLFPMTHHVEVVATFTAT